LLTELALWLHVVHDLRTTPAELSERMDLFSPGGYALSNIVTLFVQLLALRTSSSSIPAPYRVFQPRLSLQQACLKANFSKCSASYFQQLKPGLSTRGCAVLVLIIWSGLLVCFSCLCSIQTACAYRKLDRCSHRSQVRAPPVPVLCCLASQEE
jgi:hypothetical protein